VAKPSEAVDHGALPGLSAMGMVSSLGPDAMTSCAALRAGLVRQKPLELVLRDPMLSECIPVTGRSVFGMADGFTGMGGLARLSAAALKDLECSAAGIDWSRSGLYIALASDFHLAQAAKTPEGAASRDMLERTTDYLQYRKEKLLTQLIPTIGKLGGFVVPPSNQGLVFGDAAGFIGMMAQVCQKLERQELDRAVVGAVDSLVEPDVLEAYHRLGLVKRPGGAGGLIPGELAAFFLLDKQRTATARKRSFHLPVNGFAEAKESFDRFAEDIPLGRALSSSIGQTIRASEVGPDPMVSMIGDLNGDSYRAADWGHAIVRLKAEFPWIETATLYPAAGFGDTGAASAAAATGLAIYGWLRPWSQSKQTLIFASNDNGVRGSFCLWRAN
jgi:hypothetical protein